MEEAIAGVEEGQARLARAAERITGEVARRMQEIGEQEAEGDAMATDPAAVEREAMQEDTSASAGGSRRQLHVGEIGGPSSPESKRQSARTKG